MIELDVLGLADGTVVISHDADDAERRSPLTLDECLDAFTRPPLDAVELDCDLKTVETGERLVQGLRERDLVGRAMISGLNLSGVGRIRPLDTELRVGWTYPDYRRGWMESAWAAPLVGAGIAMLRRRLPVVAARELPRLGIDAIWPQWRLVTRRLVEVAEANGAVVCAWTVDDAAQIRALRELGVHGVCTNDPRLFDSLEAASTGG